jgi:hypothetical protein
MHIGFHLLALAVLVGCTSPPPLEIDVQHGVPASQLSLRISEPGMQMGEHPIESISLSVSPGVERNPGSPATVVWVADHIKGQEYLRPPVTLKLGGALPGYTSSAAPPLVLGWYEARVNAGSTSALTRFRVTVHDSIE